MKSRISDTQTIKYNKNGGIYSYDIKTFENNKKVLRSVHKVTWAFFNYTKFKFILCNINN